MLTQTVRNSSNHVHLFKVKYHAGIVGNECANSVARYQATRVDSNHADAVMPCAGAVGNPFHDIHRLAFEGDTLPDATTS